MSHKAHQPNQLTTSSRVLSPAPLSPADEIDLLDLLLVLFKAKWVIIGAVFACALLGLVANTLLPQKWTSNAELVPAQARELSTMHKALNQLALLDIHVDASPAWLIAHFIQTYDSQIVRREFIAQSDYYRQLTAQMRDAQEKARVLSALAEQAFSLSTPKDKGMEDKAFAYYRLGVTARSAQEAHALLQGYIDFVARRVEDDLRYRIQDQVDQILTQKKAQYQLNLERWKNQQQVNIRRLNYSLALAQAAGINKPMYGNGATFKDDGDFPIALGVNALRQKLDIERAQTDPSDLSADLKNAQLYIERLSQVQVADLQIQPFKYLMLPSMPLQKASPKGRLIVLLAAIAGLLLSSALVLMRHALASRHACSGASVEGK